jgi:hypothetical protein
MYTLPTLTLPKPALKRSSVVLPQPADATAEG